ncbi:alpha/beta-hydrolase [Thozetella sp. PMI_491]|nr:alpha/beta-hydrolase [Thozetella sp. PMI_491]
MDALFLKEAPPLDPAWLAYAESEGLDKPRPRLAPLARQPIYAAECRELVKRMTAAGARDHHLSNNLKITDTTVPSSLDAYAIPVRQYDNVNSSGDTEDPKAILLYIHGGGLVIGESDSEELSCLRILKESGIAGLRIYSVGYRLMPTYPATTCVSDCIDVFHHLLPIAETHTGKATVLILGSSSGGELAALVSQAAAPGTVQGVVLRGPVTVDSSSGDPGAKQYVPEEFAYLYHSGVHESFFNALGSGLSHDIPRDGLPRMPLEAPVEELQKLGLPRTWIQVCTNDFLYSDGMCYAKLLADSGVEVHVNVVEGWPHTFWLKAPQLPKALDADRAMLGGLAWVAGAGELQDQHETVSFL